MIPVTCSYAFSFFLFLTFALGSVNDYEYGYRWVGLFSRRGGVDTLVYVLLSILISLLFCKTCGDTLYNLTRDHYPIYGMTSDEM